MSKLAIPAGRNRYLTPGHITFFRAAMEGVDLRRCWEYCRADPDTNRSAGLHSISVVFTAIGATKEESSLPAAGLTYLLHLRIHV